MPDGAGHVTDVTARAAHHVVVVVAAEELVAGGGALRLDPAQDLRLGERVEDVVHGLRGHRPQPVEDPASQVLCGGVRVRRDLGEDRETRCGDPEVRSAQQFRMVGGHTATVVVYLERVKLWGGSGEE